MVRRSLLPVIAALVLLSVGCSAQSTMECGSKPVVTGFNATQYMGKWYEYAKHGAMPYEEGGVCVTAEYSMPADVANITVVNSMKNNATLETTSTTGWAGFAGQPSEGKLMVHFPTSTEPRGYWVLKTDYDNYAIVWSCGKKPGSQVVSETSWILVRNVSQWNMTMAKVEEAMKGIQLPLLEDYTQTEQSSKYCGGAEHVMGALISVVMASLFALLH